MSDSHYSEAEVVRTADLAPVLRAWIVTYLKERPKGHQPVGIDPSVVSEEHLFVGPIQVLADRTGMSIRAIHRINSEEIKYTGLSKADKLLLAIDQHYLLGTQVPVVPNPKWSAERWQEYMSQQGCV